MELTTKYRPTIFDDVLGQESVVESLKDVIKRDNKLPPCLLLSGAPGLGKTTLARIAAASVGCRFGDGSIIEVNGSEKTSIDDMRDILDVMMYAPFGKNKHRVVIIDEAHRLSKQAWDSLLKPTEEPNPGNSWIFCSTEPTKIPKAILTRCVPPSGYTLKPVSIAKIRKLLEYIIEKEGFSTKKDIVSLILLKCEGSPRQAIKWLEAVHNVPTVLQAQDLLKSLVGDETPIVLTLGRILKEKGSWPAAVAALRESEEDPEGIRLGITRYFTTVILRSKSMDETKHALNILHLFSKPCYPSEKQAPLLLAIAQVLID